MFLKDNKPDSGFAASPGALTGNANSFRSHDELEQNCMEKLLGKAKVKKRNRSAGRDREKT